MSKWKMPMIHDYIDQDSWELDALLDTRKSLTKCLDLLEKLSENKRIYAEDRRELKEFLKPFKTT